MNLTPIKANMNVLHVDEMDILFSYKTPVAAVNSHEELLKALNNLHYYAQKHGVHKEHLDIAEQAIAKAEGR